MKVAVVRNAAGNTRNVMKIANANTANAMIAHAKMSAAGVAAKTQL